MLSCNIDWKDGSLIASVTASMNFIRFLDPRILPASLAALLTLSFTGCATYNRIAPYPATGQPAKVEVGGVAMSKMSELPLGAYYDPDRQIIVTGHQKGVFTGMMFGLVGVMVADSMNRSSAKDKYGAAAAQGSDLKSILAALLEDPATVSRAPQWTREAAKVNLQLTPYALFTVEKTGQARLYAMLRAELPAAGDKPAWSVRYFAHAPGQYPLEAEGWMKPERFQPAMKAALAKALAACIDDTHGRLTGTKTVTAKGRYPYINEDFELRAIVAQENPDTLVVRLAVGDAMVLAGTHVLDRADYQIKPADFKDPRN